MKGPLSLARPPSPSLPAMAVDGSVPILVVDDNAAKRLALRAVLFPLGHTIVEADSGAAALRRLLEQDFAVILLDVCMPIMDGFETAALIRLRLQSEMTPIIFITAFGADEITHSDLYAEGAVDFMFAPVPPNVLRAKVSVFANLHVRAQALATQALDVQLLADQLTLLTDAAPIGIFKVDPDGRYVYTNPHWSEITGIPLEEAAGQRWRSILGTELPAGDVPDSTDSTGARSEACYRFELGVGAAMRVLLVRVRPISDGRAGVDGWVGTLSDITAEAGVEAIRQEIHGELTALARLDPLTGLGNRRALQEGLERLEARTARYGHRYCIALFDVDLFKSYNDTHGHQAGDRLLQAVADELTAHIRAGDELYRYGGDEFLCILPEQPLTEATQAVERMRAGVEALAVPHAHKPGDVLTLSAGIAMLDTDHSLTTAEVLKAADEALFRAKRLGRNRVEVPTALLA